ncbi:MAG: response regulator transcription factor [Streptosporangiaceae bacterium]
MPVHLAVIEGQPLIRYGLRELIAHHPDIEIVAECEAAADARRVIAEHRPNVVTGDVMLPDGDGLQLARELRDSYGDLGIVILTSKQEDDVLFRALETGVSAFVAKTAPVEEVLAAIRHAAVAATSFTASGLAMAFARRRAAQEQLALSPREKEVLHLLHDGLSIPAIAIELYISVSTTKTYVARLYEKLGAASRAQALMAALHHGLIDYQQNVLSPGAQARPGSARARHNRDMPAAASVSRVSRRPETERVPAGIAMAPLSAGMPAGS